MLFELGSEMRRRRFGQIVGSILALSYCSLATVYWWLPDVSKATIFQSDVLVSVLNIGNPGSQHSPQLAGSGSCIFQKSRGLCFPCRLVIWLS